MRLLVFWVALGGILTAPFSEAIPTVRYSGDSHFDFGFYIGAQMKDAIIERFALDPQLQQLAEWADTRSGAEIVDGYYQAHQKLFPNYILELEGMAEGAEQSLAIMLLVNLREELSYFLLTNETTRVDHCSDYLVNTGDVIMGGHNEDSSLATVNHTALLDATFQGNRLQAYLYAGELPSCAFGLNGYGQGFTLNFVQPKNFIKFGIGRNFISRALFTATSFEDAKAIASVAGQGSGRSIQLFDFTAKRLANLESAGDRSLVTEVLPHDSPIFHANLYVHLDVEQFPDVNSEHRENEARHLPSPSDWKSLARVLGTTKDPLPAPHYTIYQTGPDLYTMATARYDLNACSVTVMTGNPAESNTIIANWTVPQCEPTVP